jgi:hypothetical protein
MAKPQRDETGTQLVSIRRHHGFSAANSPRNLAEKGGAEGGETGTQLVSIRNHHGFFFGCHARWNSPRNLAEKGGAGWYVRSRRETSLARAFGSAAPAKLAAGACPKMSENVRFGRMADDHGPITHRIPSLRREHVGANPRRGMTNGQAPMTNQIPGAKSQ